MPGPCFFVLEGVAITKDGTNVLDGVFDVWFMESAIYFLHYFSSKKEFHQDVREARWGMTAQERLAAGAGSFLLLRAEVASAKVRPLQFVVYSAGPTRRINTYALDLAFSGGRLELMQDAIRDRQAEIEVYSGGGAVFREDEYRRLGLDIDGPAPSALASMLTEKNVGPEIGNETLERLAANREYMDLFWGHFLRKTVLGKDQGQVLRYAMTRLPPGFRREVLTRGRESARPRRLSQAYLGGLAGLAFLALAILIEPAWLKVLAGFAGFFWLGMFGLAVAVHRKQTRAFRGIDPETL